MSKKIIQWLKSLKINGVIKALTYSDCLLWGGYNMMNATAAIYLERQLPINPYETIAFGFSIYMITRSVIQLPIAKFLDKHTKYTDEAYAITLSCLIMGASIFSYQFISSPVHLYLAQFVFGIGAAINMPAWRKTFAKFVDKDHEGVQYSVYDAITNMTVAALTSIGGIILARTNSFIVLFNVASIIMVSGGFFAIMLLREEKILLYNKKIDKKNKAKESQMANLST